MEPIPDFIGTQTTYFWYIYDVRTKRQATLQTDHVDNLLMQ